MGHNHASTSGNFKAISLSSLSFGGRYRGECWGGGGGADPKCNQFMSILKDPVVAAKMFKFTIMF